MKNPNARIQFRYAHADDAACIAKVYGDAKEASTGVQDPIFSHCDFKKDKENFLIEKMYMDKSFNILLALKENMLVGFVRYTKTTPNSVHIDEFYAIEKTGSALHKKVIMAENAETISLNSTSSARTAYETWGYRNTIGDRMVLDGLRMQAWKESMPKQYPRFPKTFTDHSVFE